MTNKFVPGNDNKKANTGILSGEAAQNDGVKTESYAKMTAQETSAHSN